MSSSASSTPSPSLKRNRSSQSANRSSQNAINITINAPSLIEKIKHLQEYFGLPVHHDHTVYEVAAGNGVKLEIDFEERIDMLYEITITGTMHGHHLKPYHSHLLYTGNFSNSNNKGDRYQQYGRNKGKGLTGKLRVHALIMAVFNGAKEVMLGLDVSHLCHNCRCGRPTHMCIETHKKNVDRVICKNSGFCHGCTPPCLLAGKIVTEEKAEAVCKPDDPSHQKPDFKARMAAKEKQEKRHEKFVSDEKTKARIKEYRKIPLVLRTITQRNQANRDFQSIVY